MASSLYLIKKPFCCLRIKVIYFAVVNSFDANTALSANFVYLWKPRMKPLEE